MKIIIILLLSMMMLALCGCPPQEERLTQQQWVERFKPADINEAKAMSLLQTEVIKAKGEIELEQAKLKQLAAMEKFKMMCAAGFVLAIIATGIGMALKQGFIIAGGLIGIIASLGGFGLANADIHYGKTVAATALIIGLVIGGVAASAAIILIIRALWQIINRIEEVKVKIPEVKTLMKSDEITSPSSFTKKIVSTIKGDK